MSYGRKQFAPYLLEARDEHFKDDTGPPADGIGAA
jgi:hypothetical protein